MLNALLSVVALNPQVRNIKRIGLKGRTLEPAPVPARLYLCAIVLSAIGDLLCYCHRWAFHV